MKTSGEIPAAEPFNRLSDSYVKYVLGSPERKHITIAFINAVLKHAAYEEGTEPVIIEDIEFIDREKHGESDKSKGARFDVLARSADGRIFHIEIQVARDEHFMQRSFYYVSQSFSTQIQKGENYGVLKPVVYIGIMDFALFGNPRYSEDWYSLHKVMNVKTHVNTLPEVEFHMIELPLLRRRIVREGKKPSDELEELLCYFGSIGGGNFMEEIAERNPMISELEALETVYRMDPWTVRKFMLDKADEQYREFLLKEQHRKGREEGRMEELRENARRLRAQGILTDEQISQALNLTIDFVKSL
ncbi:MAG: Rpn family recombination-promoting nuclease/putative transposase [Synergistaceae bacterium]|nr:Rpn family recombination-promoting nuclease/putative transposase [Synergistaceae bacterium]